MELNLKLKLPEDFSMLCEIFQIKPEVVVESIVNNISFPFFFSHLLAESNRWPTLLFLELLNKEEYYNEKEMDFNDPYLDKVNSAIECHLQHGYNDENQVKAETAARVVMRQWHKDLLKERARYLIDNLPNAE